jgi:spore germination protein KB
LQFTMLYMTAIGIINHVIIIPSLLTSSGRDAWTAVIATSFATFLWLIIIYFTMKKTNQTEIFDWFSQHWGKLASRLIALILILTLLVCNVIILRDTSMWSKISYLPETPLLVILLTIITPCTFAAVAGLQTIVITNGILLPFVIIFGFLVMSGNIPKKDYSLLFPVLEHGIKPLLMGMIYVSSGIVYLVTAILIQHQLKKKIRYRNLLITGIILILLTLGPTIGAIAEFGVPTATSFRYPAFEQWVILNIGEFIEHIDFLSIYQWLTGTFIHLSFGTYLIIRILKIKPGFKQLLVSILIAALEITASLVFASDIIFWKITHQYLLPGILFILLSISLVLFIFSFKRKKKEFSHHDPVATQTMDK